MVLVIPAVLIITVVMWVVQCSPVAVSPIIITIIITGPRGICQWQLVLSSSQSFSLQSHAVFASGSQSYNRHNHPHCRAMRYLPVAVSPIIITIILIAESCGICQWQSVLSSSLSSSLQSRAVFASGSRSNHHHSYHHYRAVRCSPVAVGPIIITIILITGPCGVRQWQSVLSSSQSSSFQSCAVFASGSQSYHHYDHSHYRAVRCSPVAVRSDQ